MTASLLLPPGTVPAQDRTPSIDSLFDDSDVRTFGVKNVQILCEVEAPGPVDLSQCPLRNAAIKEIAVEKIERIDAE